MKARRKKEIKLAEEATKIEKFGRHCMRHYRFRGDCERCELFQECPREYKNRTKPRNVDEVEKELVMITREFDLHRTRAKKMTKKEVQEMGLLAEMEDFQERIVTLQTELAFVISLQMEGQKER